METETGWVGEGVMGAEWKEGEGSWLGIRRDSLRVAMFTETRS